MNNADIARTLVQDLNMDMPPVALAFVGAPPPGCETTAASVPSACAFWRDAERGVFFAPAERHHNCPVGAMVMGFDLPEAVGADLAQVVEGMAECGYLGESEAEYIPVAGKRGARGILYGPLGDFPIASDAILAWLTPGEAMILNEAAGFADWAPSTSPAVTGRPACAAIPTAMSTAKTTFSLGCTGMRTFTRIGRDRLLAVLPGTGAAALCEALARTRAANDTMQFRYEERRTATE